MLGFTLLVSILTGLVFGTLPAVSSRVNLVNALKSGGKGTSDAGGRRRVQSALIVAQVAVSVVLLVGAGLLLLSFYRLQSVDGGYKADRVVTAEIFGNFTKYPDPRVEPAAVYVHSRASRDRAGCGVGGHHQCRAAGRRQSGQHPVRDPGTHLQHAG